MKIKSCGEQLDLLFEAHVSDDFLAMPAAAVVATTSPPMPVAVIGDTIGPYKLREQIGEGGMGVVYLAEQTDPVRRKIALKIVRPGMASQDVVARFEAERQVLAIMDHPNIARMFDSGADEAGQPYFVMELVQGLPITEFCNKQRLNVCAVGAFFESLPGGPARAPKRNYSSRPQAVECPRAGN